MSRPGGTLSLVPLVFWPWLIGALGAVLAIPLTLLASWPTWIPAAWADALLARRAGRRRAPHRPEPS